MTPDDTLTKSPSPSSAAEAAAASPPAKSGHRSKHKKPNRNTLSATATRATPAHSWTVRSIMEGATRTCMLEGMMIAAVACGATEGYIYVRAEYPLCGIQNGCTANRTGKEIRPARARTFSAAALISAAYQPGAQAHSFAAKAPH